MVVFTTQLIAGSPSYNNNYYSINVNSNGWSYMICPFKILDLNYTF